ncbi:GAF domain-containing protein [Leptolyngbya sp. FACHB-711]|uniref:GAF domain-containing protein n=1 Tax=unclassified Leptolyngbya TaxID=2650499 RepID=UPI001684341F|nr:GAF domain-containing protein [Leptolyngbya sp. FACHB-711]MBD1850453.1 GAF domain-containing protein [Cyanobacteria bacterium FACHB-502]MBD2026045.1 GAF domain-containing protein [Leptolyngbya sp. FACHB-711]
MSNDPQTNDAQTLPNAILRAFAEPEPEAVFVALLPALCEVLNVDRCFLLLRNPDTRIHRVICWRRDPNLPDTSTDGWQPEDEWEKDDPMFAAALATQPSIFIEDIETASPDRLNRDFERQYLGHRALVHAHVCQNQQLWGILQPAVFGHPRMWSKADRETIDRVVEMLIPIVVESVKAAAPQAINSSDVKKF